eukprot:Amastigsp_a362560_11.p5 type:complete len:105 gc:universal Amastigsp_a362560_11:510-196(-)
MWPRPPGPTPRRSTRCKSSGRATGRGVLWFSGSQRKSMRAWRATTRHGGRGFSSARSPSPCSNLRAAVRVPTSTRSFGGLSVLARQSRCRPRRSASTCSRARVG